MYQIRHHLNTNLVLCKDGDGQYLHWQDKDMMGEMPNALPVQATTVEALAEDFTVLSLHYPICHDQVAIMDDIFVIPMTIANWKNFDARVKARIVGKQLAMDYADTMDAFRQRGLYLEERTEQEQQDYQIALLMGAGNPSVGTIIRINTFGKRHLARLAELRKGSVPGATPREPVNTAPASQEGELTNDPKYMYGVKLPFWKEVLVTIGLGAIISNIDKE